MRARSVLTVALGFVLAIAMTIAPASGAQRNGERARFKVPVSGTSFIEKMKLPRQPSAAQAEDAVEAAATTESQCAGDDETLVLSIPSFDPDHPGSQDVVFFRETDPASTGKATLWVAWDFLVTDYGRQDVITCDQLAFLQGQLDSIVETDVHYFGTYQERPAGNENIDILIYNIVDEDFFDPEFGSYISGFFSVGFQAEFDRNIVFIDSLDWEAYLGPQGTVDPRRVEGTVAHELEHLIHNDHDGDEDSFIDEGLAELAVFLNGFGHTSNTVWFLAFHRDSLTVWGSQLEDYGGSYLFQLYLLENFGEQDSAGVWDNAWTRNLVEQDLNGIAGVEAQTDEEFNELFDAWILANLVDDPSLDGAGGFPLGYDNIDVNPYNDPNYGPWSIRRAITDIYGAGTHGNLPISRYGGGSVSGTVEFPIGEAPPYAGIYKSYAGAAEYRSVRLDGAAASGVAPVEGTLEAASGGGHMLTDRTLELNTPVGGTLTFQTWYDLEEEWDYGFVEASTDGGTTWTKLVGSITQHSENPNASTAWTNALGTATSTDAAITGNSGGWVEATFTLPAASGVLVRFNYYTDEAVNGQGWFIDDVQVDGFADGFESGGGNWSLGGWTVTTGLFDNDWIVAYENPINRRGRRDVLELAYLDGTIVTNSAGNQVERILGQIDTSRLGNDELIVAFANRPDESPFDASYLLLVRKKG